MLNQSRTKSIINKREEFYWLPLKKMKLHFSWHKFCSCSVSTFPLLLHMAMHSRDWMWWKWSMPLLHSISNSQIAPSWSFPPQQAGGRQAGLAWNSHIENIEILGWLDTKRTQVSIKMLSLVVEVILIGMREVTHKLFRKEMLYLTQISNRRLV